MGNTRQTGAKYEEMAADYLMGKGYEILERNYRNRFGEIDIIAQKEQCIIFIEVKYRSSNRSGSPLEAVDERKQHQLSRVAYFYCGTKAQGEDTPCRFDVIAIDLEGQIQHIENAFDFQR
ncbi:MAG: YraN family protein [Eubacterium sp.]|nr:YraN family protein [Eubacterium sp.]